MKVTLMALTGLLAVASFCACDKNNDNNPALNATDSSYVMMAGMGNTAEIQTSQLALTKSTNEGIRSYAQMMITDHTNAQNELKTIVTKYGLTVPDSVDAAHAATAALLTTLTERAFDSAYIVNQVADHNASITLYETERNNGRNADLKNFATGKLPALQMHLMHADSLAANY
jgi:putative membrane protein